MALISEVTLLITHYNRSSSLERLLKTFKSMDIDFEQIVVSDDGSKAEHLETLMSLREQYSFELVTTPTNRGLGHNINKGQDKVITKYTLYVQEDFVPQPLLKQKLICAVNFMNNDPALDSVRFYAYFKYPFLKPFTEGFSEMMFSGWPWYFNYRKFYYYSDHPHLRRSDFFNKFGRYKEGIAVERTEYRMMMSYLKKKGKSLFFDDFTALFTQENSSVEPSTVHRNFWRESKNPIIVITRHLYRLLRFNIDYLRTTNK